MITLCKGCHYRHHCSTQLQQINTLVGKYDDQKRQTLGNSNLQKHEYKRSKKLNNRNESQITEHK